MNVEFTKTGEVYRGEFTVTSDFNIHIEKEMAGDCYLYVKGVADGEYASITDTHCTMTYATKCATSIYPLWYIPNMYALIALCPSSRAS